MMGYCGANQPAVRQGKHCPMQTQLTSTCKTFTMVWPGRSCDLEVLRWSNAVGRRGLSLSLVQLFLRQLLDALVVLRDASIIHCDIKVGVNKTALHRAGGVLSGVLKTCVAMTCVVASALRIRV